MNNYLLFLVKKCIFLCLIFLFYTSTTFATSGIFESYVIVQANGGSVNYYDLNASTANPDFHGFSFGTFSCTSSLIIKGGQNKTYKNGTDNILNGYLHYRIFKIGTDPNTATWYSINLSFDRNLTNPGDQQWTGTSGTTNVLQGLADGSYSIEVYSTADFNYNGGSGTHYMNLGGANYKASFTISNPISITAQPTNPSTFCVGSNVSLSTTATGADTYYWQEEISSGNWVNISGNTGALSLAGGTTSITFNNLITTKKVRCLLTNCGGLNQISTNEITLSPQQPSINIQPVDAIDCYQNVVRFFVGASNVSYQWQRKRPTDADFIDLTGVDANDVSDASTNYLRIAQVGSANNLDGTLYRCKITSLNAPFCTNITNTVTLFVNEFNTVSVTKSPLCVGEPITFTANIATGAARLQSYQWFKNNISTGSINGANNASYSTTITSTSDNNWGIQGIFQSKSTNITGITTIGTCSTTKEKSITVKALPATPTANNVSRCGEGTVILSASSSLSTNEIFRWYDSNTSQNILGIGASYTTTSLAVGTYTYYLSVYNSLTTCESPRTSITVTINPIPSILLGSIADICNSANSFSLPYNSIENSPDQYSISTGNPALSGFTTINNATLNTSPIIVPIPANSSADTYQFLLSVKNTSTGCISNSQNFALKINATPSVPIVSSPINYCQNIPTNALMATAVGSNTLLWYGNNSSGGTSSMNAPVPNSNVVGLNTFYVSQKNSNNCVGPRAAIDVIINEIPASPITSTVVSLCKNATVTALTAIPSGTNTLVWYDENDNILPAAPVPNTSVVGSQVFKVSQKSSLPAGCESEKVSIIVNINDLPSAPSVNSPIGYCQNSTAIALVANSIGSNSLVWYGINSVGGISSNNASIPSTNTAGTTSYFVSQKDGNNCESLRAKIDVIITPILSATITGNNAFCSTGVLNTSTTLVANPLGGDGNFNYQWHNNDGLIVGATNQTFDINGLIQTNNSEPYRLAITSGYCSSTANMTVNKYGWSDIPSILGNTPDICASGSKILVLNNPTPLGTYKWFTDASTLVQIATGTSYNTPILTNSISYFVAREQQITANLVCQTARSEVNIKVNEPPNAPVLINSANKSSFCNTESSFSLSASCNTGNSYFRLNGGSWTLGSSININPTNYALLTTLNYEFKCSLNNSCESLISTLNIVINPSPTPPLISGNTNICAGNSTVLSASGCNGQIVWSNGDTSNTVSVSSSGTYSAVCVQNACTSVLSNTLSIVVNPKPSVPTVVSNDVDNVICAGSSVQLNVSNCGGQVVWSNGFTGSFINITTSGTFSAVCVENGCMSEPSTTQTILVNALPSITLGSIPSICNNANTFSLPYSTIGNSPDKFILTSTMLGFNSVVDADLPTSPILVNIPTGIVGSNAFTISVKNSITNCISSQDFNVLVLPVLNGGSIEGSSSSVNCSGYNAGVISSVSLAIGGKSPYTYQWQFSSDGSGFNDIIGETSTTFNPPALTSTTFYRRKVTDACGVDMYSSNVHKIQIVPDPQITLTSSSDINICSGSSISLEATTIGGSGTCSATWESSSTQTGTFITEQTGGLTFSKISTNFSSNPLVTYYRVKYSCTGTGSSSCNQSISSLVKVTTFAVPSEPIILGESFLCTGNTTNLVATGCNGVVTWNQGSTGSVLSVSTAGSYSATCIQNTCVSNASNIHTIIISPTPPTPIISSNDTDNIICEGAFVELSVNNCAGNVIWSNGSTGTAILVRISGTYHATCMQNNCLSAISTSQTIVVNPIPSIPVISGNLSMCAGSTTTLTATGCTGSIVWNNGNTGSVLTVSIEGTYSAKCLADNCESSFSPIKIVSINSIPSTPKITGKLSVCKGSSALLSVSGCIGEITWSTGAIGSELQASVGTYSATCTENSCMSLSSEIFTISENPLPIINVNSVNDICNGASSFELAYSLNNADRYSLISTMPDFQSVLESNLVNSPLSVMIPSGKTGTHTFTIKVEDSITGCSTSQNFGVKILPPLTGGSIEPSSITLNCSGYNAGVISSVSLASGGKSPYTYQWQSSLDNQVFTDIVGASSVTYDPPALSSTTYYRRKVVDGCLEESYSTNIHEIKIVPDPQITLIDVSERVICSGETINLTATTLGGSGTCVATWQSSSTLSGTYVNEQVGGLGYSTTLTNTSSSSIVKYYRVQYACSGTGSGSCNQSTSSVVKVTINPMPVVPEVNGVGTICKGQSTTLTSSACNGTIVWTNGMTGTSISVSEGSYKAVCVNDCGTSIESNEIVVNVKTLPVPAVVGTSTICMGQSTALTASGCEGEVIWSNALSGTSIIVSPSTTSTYYARCVFDGCESENSLGITVTVSPIISFSVGEVPDICHSAMNFEVPYSLILGSPNQYSLTSTMPGFVSIIDANLKVSPISVTIPNGQTGTFNFTLTLKTSSTGCSAIQSFSVKVLPALTGGSIEPSSITLNCSGYNAGVISSVSLASGGKSPYTYQWQSSLDNQVFTDIVGASSVTYDPPALSSTTYYRRKVVDGCLEESYSTNIHEIKIVPDPQITLIDVSERVICSGETINLTATTLGGSGTCVATWQSSSTLSGTYVNEQVGGLGYSTTLTNTSSSSIVKYYRVQYACSGTGSGSCNQSTSSVVKVTINPMPVIPVISPNAVTLCSNQSTIITATGCNGLVTWNNGQTGTALTVSESGIFSANCTQNNCKSEESLASIVTMSSKGTVSVPIINSNLINICKGQTTTLTATNCVGIVSWSDGQIGTLISVSPQQSTSYTATCLDGICRSESSNQVLVTVIEYPVISVQPKNEADCNGNSVTLSVSASNVSDYQWQKKLPNEDFRDILGANTNTLAVGNIGGSNDPHLSEYRVILSNNACSIVSNIAVLTVNSISGIIDDQQVCSGTSVTFDLSKVTFSGTIKNFQWQKRLSTSGTWNDIAGANSSTFFISGATNADEQYYRCKITFTAGTSTCIRYTTENDSNGAKLTVLVASNPFISGVDSVCLGKSTTLTANNCDGEILWSNGQTTKTIIVSPIENTFYSLNCKLLGCNFDVSSEPFLVKVNQTPLPESLTNDVTVPETLVFSAKTTISNASLIWYNKATGGNSSTIAPTFTSIGTYNYWVSQTNLITGCESIRLPITAKILDYFHISKQPTNQVDCKGNSVYLDVTTAGVNANITYQWQRKRPNEPDFVNLVAEGNGIKGWFSKTMVVSNVGDNNNPNQTQYRCIISSGGQTITSEVSTLTVNSITGSLPNLGICIGGTNEFNLQNYFSITGNVLSYQWQTRSSTNGTWTNLVEGNGILGSTSNILKFTNATEVQGVYYRCLVKFNTNGFECIEPTDAGKLIVSGFPPAPAVTNVFYCQNSSASKLKVNSSVQNLVWYSQEFGGIGSKIAPIPGTSIAGEFKYYVADRTDEGCEGPRASITVSVGELPPAPKNTTPMSINEGEVLTFSAEGNPVENQVLRWYSSQNTSTFTTTAPTFSTAGTYTRYVAQVSMHSCVGPRIPITATIIPTLKFTKQPISQADCNGNAVTFSVSASAPSAFTYQWQRKKVNESEFSDLNNETSSSLKIANVGSFENPDQTRYRCIIKNEKGTVISEEAILQVNQILGALPTMSLCDGKPSKLSFEGLLFTGKIASYQWQKKSGNTYLDIPTTVNGFAEITETGNYRGKISFMVDRNSTCVRTVDIKIESKPRPEIPQVSNQVICQNSNFDITKMVKATHQLRWYESMTDSTSETIPPKIDVSKHGTATYVVSQLSEFGCESERKSFEIKIASIPQIPKVNDTIFCRNAPSEALLAKTSDENQIVWYASANGQEPLKQKPIPNTKLDGESIYFAASKNTDGCESERIPLKVTIQPCIATLINDNNNCLQIAADSVKGNKWFDLYDSAGRLYASVNPNGQNLGKITASIRHYGRGAMAIPTTEKGTKLMSRYLDFQSSLLKQFKKPVSLRIYYLNEELDEYKMATNLLDLSINDFNIVHYDGIREDCGFENNDNFKEGDSYVIYKNVLGNQIMKDFFFLEFEVNEFSENGATANDYTEISFAGKETENQTVALNWKSKFEVKAEKYVLERSDDCKNFVKIAEIKANGIGSSYESIDLQPLAGKSCYRLVYIDKDGTKKYLDAIEVKFTDTTSVCTVFPNPSIQGNEVSLYLRNIKEKQINLFDMLGQKLSYSLNKEETGIIKIHPDVNLSQGIHFLVVIGENGKKCIQKVVINP